MVLPKTTSHKIKRILVVDDESDICFVLGEVLNENGFVVDSYVNPTLALETFNANSYDLVNLDIKMPDLNGFGLYREIRRLDKKVKVCFLTAGEMYYAANSDILSSLPANHLIRKPIDNEELMKRINEIIAAHEPDANNNTTATKVKSTNCYARNMSVLRQQTNLKRWKRRARDIGG